MTHSNHKHRYTQAPAHDMYAWTVRALMAVNLAVWFVLLPIVSRFN